MAPTMAAARRVVAMADAASVDDGANEASSFESELQHLAAVLYDCTVAETVAGWSHASGSPLSTDGCHVPSPTTKVAVAATGSGMDNVWIVKPSTLSRGRGITVVATLSGLCDAICRCATLRRIKGEGGGGVRSPAARCKVTCVH